MDKTKRNTLFNVSPSQLSPNPHNPRMFFDEEELKELKSSIEKVGILVPLTIYKNTKKVPDTDFILLDGERRWRCAMELKLRTVPANVIDEPKDVTQNILYMFNIHHFRREWELFPTALKLEVLVKKLGTDSESTLSSFTGLTRGMIRRCKMLLWFPEEYRNTLLRRDSKISTDFFIEIYPICYRLSQEEEYRYPQGIKQFIDICIRKFLEGSISDVKEFREMRRALAYYESIGRFEDFKSRIGQLVHQPAASLEIFAVPDIEEDRTRKNIIKYVSYLNETLRTVNPNLISDIYFVDQLRELQKNLNRIIESID